MRKEVNGVWGNHILAANQQVGILVAGTPIWRAHGADSGLDFALTKIAWRLSAGRYKRQAWLIAAVAVTGMSSDGTDDEWLSAWLATKDSR
ncbi:MAG TPA: hypothetical protein V6D08_02055 [Candidatus Obscuribacterales bacterium]